MKNIPIIDIFAGPGGLSYGFSQYSAKDIQFKISLSIEKDPIAYKTLHLRAFFRQFRTPPKEYFQYICQAKEATKETLEKNFSTQWKKASGEVKNWELGATPILEIYSAISGAIKNAPEIKSNKYWILLGGPPCQAYSLAGRSRMKRAKSFASDQRHLLYKEYLKIVAIHQPAIFVMENVKGILSSKHGTKEKNGSIFNQIKADLEDPALALIDEQDIKKFISPKRHKYKIFSFVTKKDDPADLKPQDFVIKSEEWGIPQKRHRVILFGIRDDVSTKPKTLTDLYASETVSIHEVIGGMPAIRSQISNCPDSSAAWIKAIKKVKKLTKQIANQNTRVAVMENIGKLAPLPIGHKFIKGTYRPRKLSDFLYDERISGLIQHQSRSHMEADLMRYFFAATAAKVEGKSIKLSEYPKSLLPRHKNATLKKINDSRKKGKKIAFSDRFRVQIKDSPATTITSHISKDGHYYIHYDPLQCRSLTLREAARLQTFPDNYYFEGNKTEGYQQVGNAVPPALAAKLATVVANLIATEFKKKSG